MSNSVFPALPGLAGRLTISDQFDTVVYTSSNAYEVRIPKFQDPLLRFKIEYYLKDGMDAEQTFEPIRSFFRARKGSAESFLLDASVVTGRASDGVVTGQPLSVVGSYYAPIIHTVSGYDEAIYEIKTFDNLYENGVPKSVSAYAILGSNPKGVYNGVTCPSKIVHFTTALGADRAPTTPITADFHWYYRVRFAKDQLDYDGIMAQLFELNELDLVTARDL